MIIESYMTAVENEVWAIQKLKPTVMNHNSVVTNDFNSALVIWLIGCLMYTLGLLSFFYMVAMSFDKIVFQVALSLHHLLLLLLLSLLFFLWLAPSISLSVSPFSLSFSLSIHPSVYLSIYYSIHLSIRLSFPFSLIPSSSIMLPIHLSFTPHLAFRSHVSFV